MSSNILLNRDEWSEGSDTYFAIKVFIRKSLTSIDGKNEQVNNFHLEQNYPNPFNPTTIIRYSLPKNGLVTLKVFDILGREVATLANEYKVAGIYDVTFNASNLASGVYIYQLRSGDFVANKKLILMK